MNKPKDRRALCAAALLALLLVQLAMHLNCDSLIYDDWYFRGVAINGQSLLSFLNRRWQTWSSRLIIEALLCVTTRSIWLWRVLDSLNMVLMAFALCRLANAEERPDMLALAGLMVTTIPFAVLRSTGWQATGMNYYVPLTCALMACIPLADALWGRKTPPALAAFAVLCAVLGANQEQMAALIFGAHVVLGAVLVIRGRGEKPTRAGRPSPVIWLVLAVACAELAMHLLAPGNAVRAEESIAAVNLRDYGQFTLIDKLDIGLTSLTALLIYTFNPVLASCGAVVLATVIARRRGRAAALAVGLTAAFVLRAWLATSGLSGWSANNRPFEAMYSYNLLYGPDGVGQPLRWQMLAATIIALGMMALSLYLSIGHRPLAAAAVFVFALGFAVRLVMGFSPTVVESGERTMLPLYSAMMLSALLCQRDVSAEGGRGKPMAAAYALCALLAAANIASSFALAL